MKPDFKKFIRKSILFTLPFAILIIIAEISIGHTAFMHYSKVFEKVSNLLIKIDQVKILILGSSHADNAIENCDSDKIFNLANQGQDFKQDLFLLNFLGDLRGMEKIVLTVSYFSFHYSEEKEWPFRVKDYLDVQTLKPEKNIFRFNKWIYDRSVLLNYNLSPYQILKYYLLKKKIKKESANAIDLKKDAERRALPLQARYHNSDSKSIEKYFQEMLLFCRKQKKKVFLVVLPFSREYNIGIERKWRSDFDRNLSYIKEKYDLQVLDYSQDARFENDQTLFLNADHLNKKGAKKFTRILVNELNKIRTDNYGEIL